MRIVIEVDRDIRRVGVAEDALERAFSRSLDRRVDLVLRGLLLGNELEVDNRHVRRRHADGEAVELAVEIRQHETDRLRSTRRRRDHRQCRRAAAIEILVHRVERRLIARVRVDRRHHALLDADGVVQHLRDRREAVRRARSVRDDHVLFRELGVIHAIDDGEIGAIGRSRNEHALGAGRQMCRCLVLRREDARAFHRDVDAKRPCGSCAGFFDAVTLIFWPLMTRLSPSTFTSAGNLPCTDFEAQQMRVRLDRAEIVDADDNDVLAARIRRSRAARCGRYVRNR